MADARTLITGASVAIAMVCAGWAIYESKHQTPAGGPPGIGRPGGAGGPGGGPPSIVVVTAAAANAEIEVGIEAVGTANASEAVNVSTKISNIVTAIHFTDGQNVSKGHVLVELDSAQAKAELAAATADYGESVAQYNRSREMLATQAVSQAQYGQLEATMKSNEARVAAAQARLADTYIRAPFAGRVGLRRVSVGTLISPGTVITTLDDTSSIKVDFSVPDLYVGQLRAGQSVSAHTNAYPGRRFDGVVLSIDSRIDPATRAVTVRAVVPNRDTALKPGMFLTVDLAKERRTALVIPEEALVPEQARMFVYVVHENKVTKQEVQLGRREPGRVEVTTGLAAGDRVVIEGTLKLREGALVREQGAAVT